MTESLSNPSNNLKQTFLLISLLIQDYIYSIGINYNDPLPAVGILLIAANMSEFLLYKWVWLLLYVIQRLETWDKLPSFCVSNYVKKGTTKLETNVNWMIQFPISIFLYWIQGIMDVCTWFWKERHEFAGDFPCKPGTVHLKCLLLLSYYLKKTYEVIGRTLTLS
jgi:hypothetical protein